MILGTQVQAAITFSKLLVTGTSELAADAAQNTTTITLPAGHADRYDDSSRIKIDGQTTKYTLQSKAGNVGK